MEMWLLVETSRPPTGSRVFSIADRTLVLKQFKTGTARPGYACVSYVWGPDRVPNTWGTGPANLSIHTVPALTAAIYGSKETAYWIDAFCIPVLQPARTCTLQSMGFIYAQAEEVLCSLNARTLSVIRELNQSDRLDEDGLNIMEQDLWISSVWTYQEVINQQSLSFVCPDLPGIAVDATHFLNSVGYSLGLYKKEHGVDDIDITQLFPHLDAFQDLLADWKVSDFTRCSALAIMSNIGGRKWTENENYFFSIIGAMTAEPCDRTDRSTAHLARVLMDVCEAKNDFSYIYSSAARSSDPQRLWRPKEDLLLPMLHWHSRGESQPGHYDGDAFWLDEVLEIERGILRQDAKDFGAAWVQEKQLATHDEQELSQRIHTKLARMGFTGSAHHISVDDGLFFPQTTVDPNASIRIFLSTTIKWTFGAPGIVRVQLDDRKSYVPGVFVGQASSSDSCSVQLD